MNPYGPLVGGFHHRGCSERDFLTSPLAGGAPRSDWVNDSPPKQRLSEAFSSNTADFMSMVDPCGTFHVLSKTTSRTLPPFLASSFVRPFLSQTAYVSGHRTTRRPSGHQSVPPGAVPMVCMSTKYMITSGAGLKNETTRRGEGRTYETNDQLTMPSSSPQTKMKNRHVNPLLIPIQVPSKELFGVDLEGPTTF